MRVVTIQCGIRGQVRCVCASRNAHFKALFKASWHVVEAKKVYGLINATLDDRKTLGIPHMHCIELHDALAMSDAI